jgi:uncharacterized protein YjbI with pentapeptide repeats
MTHVQASKRTYEESCRYLQQAGWLDANASIPALPASRPNYDDAILGVEFFRTLLSDAKLEYLTLPRMYFGRSEIRNVSFAGSDLSESTFCWNNFIQVSFIKCDLSNSDLRAALFENVDFSDANLANTDMRRSEYIGCTLLNANMTGVKLTRKQGEQLPLSMEQNQQIDWQDFDGDEPGGG